MQNTHEKDAALPKPVQATQPAKTLNYKKSYQYYLEQRQQATIHSHVPRQQQIPAVFSGFFYLPAYAAQRAACKSNDIEQAKTVLPKEEYMAWLWFSLKNKCTPIWQLLFNLLSDEPLGYGQSQFIHMAIKTGNPLALQYLLQTTNYDIEQEKPAYTILSIIGNGELAMMEILLDHMKSTGWLLDQSHRNRLLIIVEQHAKDLKMVHLVYTALGEKLNVNLLLHMNECPILDAEPAIVQKLINQPRLKDRIKNDLRLSALIDRHQRCINFSPEQEPYTYAKPSNKWGLLHDLLNTACATGNIQMVRMLLNNWATPNFQTLSFACNSGARTIVRALLSHFISPPVNPNFHYEPHLEPHLRDTLHPQGFNYLNVADLLIENGHVPTIHSLYSACKFGNSEKVRLFLRKGVQPDEEALRLACYSGNAALAQGMLIVYLMIYKQELKNPSSLLVAAFKSGNRALIKELKDRGFQLGQGLRKWCIDPYLNITITPMTTAAMTLMLNPRELINSNAPASVSFWADFYPNPPNPHLRNPWSNFEYSHLLFCCYTLDKLLDKLKSDIFDDKTVELAYMAHEAAPRQFFLKISHTLAHADEYQLELSACEELAALVKIVIIGNPLRYSSVEKDDIKQSLALAELEAYQLDRLAQLLLLKEIGKLVFSAPQSASTSAAVSTAGASTAFLHSPITAAGDTHANLLKLVMPIIDSEPDFFKPFTQALDEKRYSTALRRLCTSDKSKIFKLVEILLRFKHILKIDLNERVGNDQRSVLHFAARHSTAAVYDLLLKEGADPNLEDRVRVTPADYFKERHNFHTLFSM